MGLRSREGLGRDAHTLEWICCQLWEDVGYDCGYGIIGSMSGGLDSSFEAKCA